MVTPFAWQSAFVATTVALGDSIEDARAALTTADLAAAGAVVAGLAHSARDVRARTLASAIGRIAADLELARVA